MLPIQQNYPSTFTRRELLRGLGFAAIGLARCTPLKYALNSRPKSYRNSQRLDRTLRSFVVTVIPRAAIDDSNLVRIYTDEFYDFAKYAGFFANDLDERARKNFSAEFAALTIEERSEIIKQGLAADPTMSRLYYAAIFRKLASLA